MAGCECELHTIKCPSCKCELHKCETVIICGGMCKRSFHIACQSLSTHQYEMILDLGSKVKWYCQECKILVETACGIEELANKNLCENDLAVLNKLTSQKFDTLSDQISNMNIYNSQWFQRLIDLVFEKTINEPSFSVAYALLCRELALMQVSLNSEANQGIEETAAEVVLKKDRSAEYVDFSKLLETKCAMELEKNSIDNSARNAKVELIDNCTDVKKKKEMLAELEEYDRKRKVKVVGNTRFIGQLFKQNMLTVNVMQRCLSNLLETKDKDSLECLCKLIVTIKQVPEYQNIDLNPIFNVTKDIMNGQYGIVSRRVRIMVQNVVDSRLSIDTLGNECYTRLYKKVRGILNKITPQKFDILLDQFRNLNIDNSRKLQEVIDLIYTKAIADLKYSGVYALLCRECALMEVPLNSEDKKEKEETATEAIPKKEESAKYLNFRKLLVTRCQMEFEKTFIDETARNAQVELIDNCADVEKKKEMVAELYEYDRKLRTNAVGSIRFIGELFKQNMLTINIMQRCLSNLLETKDEESLECLCMLLITVGQVLDSKKVDLNPIFTIMKDIVDRKYGKISNRVRFMLQDVIDLRLSNWVRRSGRIQELVPKTMDQIRKEVENEQMTVDEYDKRPTSRRNVRRRRNSNQPSGQSSTRQTPQPPLSNSNKEVQATFAISVAQAIGKDEPLLDVLDHQAPMTLQNPTQPPSTPNMGRQVPTASQNPIPILNTELQVPTAPQIRTPLPNMEPQVPTASQIPTQPSPTPNMDPQNPTQPPLTVNTEPQVPTVPQIPTPKEPQVSVTENAGVIQERDSLNE